MKTTLILLRTFVEELRDQGLLMTDYRGNRSAMCSSALPSPPPRLGKTYSAAGYHWFLAKAVVCGMAFGSRRRVVATGFGGTQEGFRVTEDQPENAW
ncbi:hypothetical protein ACFYW8_43915 [Streptomyces sp. NPDC002742]|uniref:hypothetical protein n=1 Tax=Streptomyces sp. NPDC002742 TaxID=3364663 RepID=UPI0036A40490